MGKPKARMFKIFLYFHYDMDGNVVPGRNFFFSVSHPRVTDVRHVLSTVMNLSRRCSILPRLNFAHIR